MDLAYYLLCLALGFGALDLLFSFSRRTKARRASLALALSATVFTASTFILLAYYFLADNFSIAQVVRFSSERLLTIQKFSAIWASQAGPFLFLAFCLYVCYSTTKLLLAKAEQEPDISSKLSIIAFVMLLASFFTEPFSTLEGPAEPHGLYPDFRNAYFAVQQPLALLSTAVFALSYAFVFTATFTRERLPGAWEELSARAGWLLLTLSLVSWTCWRYETRSAQLWIWSLSDVTLLAPWLLCFAYFCSKESTMLSAFRRPTLAFVFPLALFSVFAMRGGVTPTFPTLSIAEGAKSILTMFLAGLLITACILTFKSLGEKRWARKHPLPDVLYAVIYACLIFITIGWLIGALYPHLTAIPLKPVYYEMVCYPLAIALVLSLMSLALSRRLSSRRVAQLWIICIGVGASFALVGLTGKAQVDFAVPILSLAIASFLYARVGLRKKRLLIDLSQPSSTILSIGILLILLGVLLGSTMRETSGLIYLNVGQFYAPPSLERWVGAHVFLEDIHVKSAQGSLVGQSQTIEGRTIRWLSPRLYESTITFTVITGVPVAEHVTIDYAREPGWGDSSTVFYYRTLDRDVYIKVPPPGVNFNEAGEPVGATFEIILVRYVSLVFIGSFLLLIAMLLDLWSILKKMRMSS